jgi:RNA polymerase-interacting CarD/CdnL/TRCF family regulator
MQLKVGDLVVHPAFGVGHIVKIEEKQFSAKKAACLYYRGTFGTFPETSVWTPVEAQETSSLRLVTAKSDLDQYRYVLKSRPVPSSDEGSLRHTRLVSRLKQGSFQVLCEVVRDLTMSRWQKRLGPADAAILKQTNPIASLVGQTWHEPVI